LPTGNVYFVRGGHLLKIGYAADVSKRILQLQTGCPWKLELWTVLPECNIVVERRFHEAFSAQRELGEWFRINRELTFVCDTIAAGARPRASDQIQALIELSRVRRERRELRPAIPEKRIRKAIKVLREPAPFLTPEQRSQIIRKADLIIGSAESGKEALKWAHILKRNAVNGWGYNRPHPSLDSFLNT